MEWKDDSSTGYLVYIILFSVLIPVFLIATIKFDPLTNKLLYFFGFLVVCGADYVYIRRALYKPITVSDKGMTIKGKFYPKKDIDYVSPWPSSIFTGADKPALAYLTDGTVVSFNVSSNVAFIYSLKNANYKIIYLGGIIKDATPADKMIDYIFRLVMVIVGVLCYLAMFGAMIYFTITLPSWGLLIPWAILIVPMALAYRWYWRRARKQGIKPKI